MHSSGNTPSLICTATADETNSEEANDSPQQQSTVFHNHESKQVPPLENDDSNASTTIMDNIIMEDTGCERAEKQAAGFRRQLEDALLTKSSLQARVSHLDGALKECVRQLRLDRDEQQSKIDQAVAHKTKQLDFVNAKLRHQLIELQSLLQASAVKSPSPDPQHNLEVLKCQNEALRRQLQLQSEELEIMTIERDLSTKAAETASKQNLESIKYVAKLEAECRKLKSLDRISSLSNDHRITHAASSYSESLTDSQSDGPEQLNLSECDSRRMNGWGSHECNPPSSSSWASALITELNQFSSEKMVDKNMHSSIEINLMDDFLEMERLVALPDTGPQLSVGCDPTSEKPELQMENNLRAQLDSLAHRTAELEENISRLEMENSKLVEYIYRIEAEKGELEEIIIKVEGEKGELEMVLDQTQRCLDNSGVQLIETKIEFEQLERDLREANEKEQYYKTLVNSREQEAELMLSQIKSLQADIDNVQAISEESSFRCKELEDALKKKEKEQVVQQAIISNDELKLKEVALTETQACLMKSQAHLKEAEMKINKLRKNLEEANEEKMTLISELHGVREEVHTMSTEIESLNQQIQKERNKLKEMENELQEKTQELNDARQRAFSNKEFSIKQEDLADAAGKLVDCQMTIASIGNQLKSLATLEDFLIDTASISGHKAPAPLMVRHRDEPWRLHSHGTFLLGKELEPLSPPREDFSPFAGHSGTTSSSAFFSNYLASERSANDFGEPSSHGRN